jgi:hypothetical protein
MMAAPPALNIPTDEASRDDDDYVDSGALIPLDKADGTTSGSIQLLGVRTVILSLIMCMGRVIADGRLCVSLASLVLTLRSPPFPAQATQPIPRYRLTVHFA